VTSSLEPENSAAYGRALRLNSSPAVDTAVDAACRPNVTNAPNVRDMRPKQNGLSPSRLGESYSRPFPKFHGGEWLVPAYC